MTGFSVHGFGFKALGFSVSNNREDPSFSEPPAPQSWPFRRSPYRARAATALRDSGRKDQGMALLHADLAGAQATVCQRLRTPELESFGYSS